MKIMIIHDGTAGGAGNGGATGGGTTGGGGNGKPGAGGAAGGDSVENVLDAVAPSPTKTIVTPPT